MQISTKNLIASNALWDALISLTDSRIATGEVANGYAPYSVVHLDNDDAQHVVITGNNASMMITRNEPVPGSVSFSVNENGYFGELVHEALSFDGMDEIASDEYLAEIINFVDTFRAPAGTEFRNKVAQVEVGASRVAETTTQYHQLLDEHQNNRLTAHHFYDQSSSLTDIEQLVCKDQSKLEPGIYTYASLGGGGKVDHLVFVSKNRRNTAVAYLHSGKVVIMSNVDKLGQLIEQTKIHVIKTLEGLVDEESIIYSLFDQVNSDASSTHDHALDAMLTALDLGHVFDFSSPARSRMFAASSMGRAMRAASRMADTLAAVRGTTDPYGTASEDTRPGCLCGKCKR